jgi:hypothetical protein
VNGTTLAVVVGAVGAIYTSADGTTWTSKTSGKAVNLRAVAWNGTNLYLAVGDSRTCVKSADGTTWSSVTIAFTAGANIVGAVWDGSYFDVVADNGQLAISDGVNPWLVTYPITSEKVLSEKVVNSIVFVLTENGEIYSYAGSGTSWTLRKSSDAHDLKTVAYSTNDLIYVALGDQIGFLTDDYTDWDDKEIDFTGGMGFDYAYLAPGDLLNPIGVNDDGLDIMSDTIDYQREGDIIGSDSDPLYMKYVARITDPLKYPEHLVNTIAVRLAYEMSPTIKGQVNRQELLSEYRMAIIMAQGMQGRQGFNKGAVDSDLWINQGR